MEPWSTENCCLVLHFGMSFLAKVPVQGSETLPKKPAKNKLFQPISRISPHFEKFLSAEPSILRVNKNIGSIYVVLREERRKTLFHGPKHGKTKIKVEIAMHFTPKNSPFEAHSPMLSNDAKMSWF